MSKIVCEICGTSYSDTATSCPLCGWARSGGAVSAGADEENFDLDFLKDEAPAEHADDFMNGLDTAADPVVPAAPRKKRDVFDYDAVNEDDKKSSRPGRKAAPVEEEEPEYDEDYEDEEDDEPHTNVFLVVILVILIVALLLTSGFIFWRYYLPGMRGSTETEPVVTETVETEPSEETEAPSIPCTGLSLVSGMEKLTKEGQNWLLHVKAAPEDTTDKITFASSDESVATVNDEGRVTAVGEGEAKIIITCGDEKLECPVIISYEAETEPTEAAEPAAAESTEPGAQTEATEAAGATEETKGEVNPDIVLKLKRSDITFGISGVYVTLALDCDLKPEDVEWSSRNPNVASVDKQGNVTAVGPGLTVIKAKYGDQEVECIVRCNF